MSRPSSGPWPSCFVLIAGMCALSTIVLGGCSRSAPLVPMSLDEFETEILAELELRSHLIETLMTQMTIQVDSHGERSEVRAILRFKRPDAFRLDVLDPLGAPMVIIRASQDTFSMVHLREAHGMRGPLSDDLLRRQFGMDIRMSDVKSAIYADPFADGIGDGIEVGRQANRVVVTRPSERVGLVEELHIQRVKGEPVVAEWWVRDKKGRVIQHMRFWNYTDIGGILQPLDAEIERPGDDTRLRFRAVQPELNREIQDASFQHTFPPGAEVEQIDG